MMNSLTPIASLSESLQRRLARSSHDPEIVDAAETIARRSHGLMAFVDRYRLVADLPQLELAEFSAREMVADIDRLMGEMSNRRGVAYSSTVEPSDAKIIADRQLIEQALINLVKNAVEAASGQPSALVQLLLRAVDDVVTIEVADNGPGVPDDLRNDIFVPFFSTHGGSGIGLSLARQIAVAHAGTLEMRSSAASQTVFALSVPRRA
jgi:signal transduction histidine kinase